MNKKEVEILLVEDNPDDKELTIIALKSNNITNKIQVARDGAEALEYLFGSVDGETLKCDGPMMVLLDLKLPKIDGLNVLRRIKEHPEAKNIPVVVLTSSSEERDMVESYRLGVSSYIRKPLDFNQFSPPLQPELQDYQQQYPIQKLSTISQTGIIEIDMRMIGNELNKLPDGWTVLLETSAENALEVSLSMIKALTDKNYFGIVLSASRPYENLSTLYQNNGINMGKILILDLVSKNQSAGLEETGNVLYLENAYSLTNISIAIDECYPGIQGKKFIFIDSITTMLIHNNTDVFARFIHSVLTKMRLNRKSSLLVSLENETNREVQAEISQLCDKILKI
jgi:two-component system, response regulator